MQITQVQIRLSPSLCSPALPALSLVSVWVSRSVDTAARERVCLRDQRIRSSAQLGVGGAASCGQRKQLLARKDVEANGEASAVVRGMVPWEVVRSWARARCGSAMTAAGTRTQRTHAQGNTYILIYRARDCATRLRVHDARSVAHVYRSDRLAARRWPRTSSPSAQRVLMYPSTSVAFVAAPSKSSMCTLLG